MLAIVVHEVLILPDSNLSHNLVREGVQDKMVTVPAEVMVVEVLLNKYQVVLPKVNNYEETDKNQEKIDLNNLTYLKKNSERS